MQHKKRHWKRFKPKKCPICGIIHRGANSYCSKSCSNRGRTVTIEQKNKTSQSMLRYYHSTPEGLAHRQKITNMNNGLSITKIEDIDIELPDIIDPDFL